jgi:hypothetical protein
MFRSPETEWGRGGKADDHSLWRGAQSGVDRGRKRSMAAKPHFKAHLLDGPKSDEFAITRSSDTGRDIEL